MNKLIKAENYRFRCVSGFKSAYVALLVLLLFMPLGSDWEILDKNLGEALEHFYRSLLGVGTMMIPLYMALWTVSGYSKKTAYYEVMAGSRINHIIGSKLISTGLLQGIGFLVATFGMGFVLIVRNGVGTVSDLGWRMVLVAITFLHMCMVTVLMSLTIKQSIAATLAAYCRFWIFESVLMFALGILLNRGWIAESVYQLIVGQLVQEQFVRILLDEVTMRLIVEVFAGFTLDVVLWYSIAYATMKKKLYE